MKNVVVEIDARRISDWNSFYDVFAEAFGFPDFFGRNMDAWIDCMTSLDSPEDGMTRINVEPGQVVVIQLNHVKDFARRCPEQCAAIIEGAAFVNWRRIDIGEEPVIALSFFN